MHTLNYWVYFAPITPAFCSLLPNIPKILLAKLAHPYSYYGLPFVHGHHRSICVQKCVAMAIHSVIYFVWLHSFLMQSISYQLQYKYPWSRGCNHIPHCIYTMCNVLDFIAAQQLHVACVSTFTLNFVG